MREIHLLGLRISSRWSFVRREIHSTFTYRRTSAIVNSQNKLFQLHRQRRGPLATENWNLRRILDRIESKVEKPWDYRRIGTQSFQRSSLSFSLFSYSLLLHPSIPRPLFRTIVQLILILFRFGETSFASVSHPGKCDTALIGRKVRAIHSFHEIILLESCCIILRL